MARLCSETADAGRALETRSSRAQAPPGNALSSRLCLFPGTAGRAGDQWVPRPSLGTSEEVSVAIIFLRRRPHGGGKVPRALFIDPALLEHQFRSGADLAK